jgi:hypothetical protein
MPSSITEYEYQQRSRKLRNQVAYEKARRIQALTEVTALEAKLEAYTAIMEWILECPFTVDPATVPAAGIEANPDQVVLNISMAYVKRQKLTELTENYRGTKKAT